MFAVNFAVLVATSLATDELKEFDEPDMVAAVMLLIKARDVTSESINAPAEVTFVASAVFLAVLVATSEAIDELKEFDEPEIVAAVRLLISAKDVTSESINAPAEVTFDVFAVALAVFVATSEAIDELKEFDEPEIVVAVNPFINAKEVTSESIKAPALVTFEVFAVNFAVLVATSEATDELKEFDEPDIVAAVSPFINAKEVTSESIKAPAEVTLEVFDVSLAVLVATSEATDELKEVDEPDIVAAVRPLIKARDVTSESIKAPAAATEVAEIEPEIVAAVNPLIRAKDVTSESINAPALVTFEVLAVNFAVLVATSEAIDELKDVNEPDTVAELNVVTPDKLDPSPIKTFAVIVPDALIFPDDVILLSTALDPLTITFFQFGIFLFYYGWLLNMSPLPVRANNLL